MMRRSKSNDDVTGCDDRRVTPAEFAQLSDRLRATGRRCVVGITGPPGAGKSTLATYLAQSISPAPPVVPMDGFHLAQDIIEQNGLVGRKGSPETFDAWGFVKLVQRIARPADDSVVYAPRYDHNVGEPIAGAIPIFPTDGLVIVEGNYLLLASQPWAQLSDLLKLCGYVELDDAIRRWRLIDRHVQFGKAPQAAKSFVHSSDEKNAELVETTKPRASFVVQMDQ
ncbi:nucleoside/nucleotide kinase family protein [Candidatus Poriferisodalis sp.]|uniref:nucleoside/nucleotide kinase family protein n=1 Tax=Candidatus Poriferisodalis sp. TaxID=3101277 RepID=UPI003C6EACCE